TASAIMEALVASSRAGDAGSDDPWATLGSYAHFHQQGRRVAIHRAEETYEARLLREPDGAIRVIDNAGHATQRGSDGLARTARWPGHVTVFEDGDAFTFAVPDPLDVSAEAGSGSMRAP